MEDLSAHMTAITTIIVSVGMIIHWLLHDERDRTVPGIACLMIFIALMMIRSGTRFSISGDENQVWFIRYNWWGLTETREEIRWMAPTREAREGDTWAKCWCHRYDAPGKPEHGWWFQAIWVE
ncbi:MAG: hypothetical protein H6835_18470 [Planctomycetes bacterium]|nr:hypothetical protein [Planctomycetota bacterium]